MPRDGYARREALASREHRLFKACMNEKQARLPHGLRGSRIVIDSQKLLSSRYQLLYGARPRDIVAVSRSDIAPAAESLGVQSWVMDISKATASSPPCLVYNDGTRNKGVRVIEDMSKLLADAKTKCIVGFTLILRRSKGGSDNDYHLAREYLESLGFSPYGGTWKNATSVHENVLTCFAARGVKRAYERDPYALAPAPRRTPSSINVPAVLKRIGRQRFRPKVMCSRFPIVKHWETLRGVILNAETRAQRETHIKLLPPWAQEDYRKWSKGQKPLAKRREEQLESLVARLRALGVSRLLVALGGRRLPAPLRRFSSTLKECCFVDAELTPGVKAAITRGSHPPVNDLDLHPRAFDALFVLAWRYHRIEELLEVVDEYDPKLLAVALPLECRGANLSWSLDVQGKLLSYEHSAFTLRRGL